MIVRKQIQNELQKMYEAFHTKDWKSFEKFLDKEFVYNTDKCIVQNKSEFIKALKADSWIGTRIQNIKP